MSLKRSRVKNACVLGIVSCVLCCGACTKKTGLIDLSTAPALPVNVQWAVIVDPYAIYRSEPSLSASSAGYGRRGDLQEITGKRIVTESKKQVIWYSFSSGWLPETSVQVHSNELKAQAAAQELKSADKDF